ncbi:MAG: phospholipase D-like domain-containing protein [Thiolinea sp.]
MTDTDKDTTGPVDELDTATRVRVQLESVMGIPFTDGNHVTALRNGDRIFPAMLEAIEQAQHTIEFATYVYWTGNIAQKFAHVMSERARAGLTVRVLLDGFGAKEIRRELLDMMEEAGVIIRWFRPLSSFRIWMVDNRTHRKLLIVDGKIGFTGGVGIAEEWEGDVRDASEWRDNHYRLTGPAVSRFCVGPSLPTGRKPTYRLVLKAPNHIDTA